MPGSGIDKIQKDLKDGYEYDEMIEGSAGVLKDTIFPKKPKERKMSSSLLDNIRKINTGAGSQYDENVMLTYKSGDGVGLKVGGRDVGKTIDNVKTAVDAVKNIKKEKGIVKGIKKTIEDKKPITKTKTDVSTNVGDAIKNFKSTISSSYEMKTEDTAIESELTIQDWNVDDIKFTEIETVDIIKAKPLKENMSNWRDELDEDWQKVNRKDKTDGMSKAAVKAYRSENPGSKLKTAVTKDPKKLKKGSKSAKRRLAFCRRMKGMKKKLTSAKTRRDPDSRINKALRRWNC